MTQFHFLRPDWFWLLPPLALLLYWVWRRQLHNRSWQAVCDPQLLPYLLLGRSKRRRNWPFLMTLMALSIAVIALAGPTWERMPQPLFRQQSALVVVLDLSASMNATDLKPSRLVRARLKIADILHQRREGQTALVVFAGDAFTVTPLTEDSKTILSLLDSLDPALMPVLGSQPSLAIEQGHRLLQQAGLATGDLILVTDDDQPDDASAAAVKLRQDGYRLSILGVGTEEGAPIPLPGGGFFKDTAGQVVLPRLKPAALQQLAQAGGGYYQSIRIDDQDLQILLKNSFRERLDTEQQQSDQLGDRWREAGVWLLWPLALLTACAFRRGWLTAFILFALLNQPAQAFDWQQLWQRSDQRGAKAFAAEDYGTAAEHFQDHRWQASSHYRNGQYDEAAKLLENPETGDDWYNKGNALAKAGRLSEALNAYDEALELTPQDQDTLTNRRLVKEALEQQQDQQQSSSQDGDKSQQSESTPGQPEQEEQPSDSSESSQPSKESESSESSKQHAEPIASETNGHQQQQTEATTADEQANKMNDSGQEQEEYSEKSVDQPSNEEQRASQQWLQRIPDDPGGLMRRKFLYQYRQRNEQQTSDKPW